LGNKVDAVARAKALIVSIRSNDVRDASRDVGDEPLAYNLKAKVGMFRVVRLPSRETIGSESGS